MLLPNVLGLGEIPFKLRRRRRRLEYDSLAIYQPHRGLQEHDDGVKIAAKRITLG